MDKPFEKLKCTMQHLVNMTNTTLETGRGQSWMLKTVYNNYVFSGWLQQPGATCRRLAETN